MLANKTSLLRCTKSIPKALEKAERLLANRVTRLGDFSPIGLLLEAHYDFFKMKYPKVMATFWVTFWVTFCLSKFITFLPK
jgi:hypothetical protein